MEKNQTRKFEKHNPYQTREVGALGNKFYIRGLISQGFTEVVDFSGAPVSEADVEVPGFIKSQVDKKTSGTVTKLNKPTEPKSEPEVKADVKPLTDEDVSSGAEDNGVIDNDTVEDSKANAEATGSDSVTVVTESESELEKFSRLYVEQEDRPVPNNKKNNLEWIKSKIK